MEWKQSNLPDEYTMFLEHGYDDYTAIALCKAGIRTLDDAEEYLHGDELIDPGKIRGIRLATDIIWKHICSGNKICVFGDYDADGITASAVMFLALKKLGAKVTVRLPDRIEEGYGISIKAIEEQLALGVCLFVTVDNGVRAIREVKYIKEHGADIVVLDHHEPGDILPEADALIDLHIPGESYPYVELTGSALSWKVAHYMLEQMNEHEYAMSLVDLAAIGTVGDVAPLNGENRVIVKRAIRRMTDPGYDRVGVKALMHGMESLTAEDIAFRIAPCLNAPGRLDPRGAELPLILLLENDERMALRLAMQVIEVNERRKSIQQTCYQAIKAAAEERIAAGDKVLVLKSMEAPVGIVGLLAGNLKEDFCRPAIVFGAKSDENGELHWVGSARSIEAFHMLSAIESCKSLLERYGGHRLAAGLTVCSDDEVFEKFRKRMNAYADSLTENDLNPVGEWDIDLPSERITDELFSQIGSLEPFGAGAPRPVVKVCVELSNESHRFMGEADQHVKLFANGFSLVGFSLAEKYVELGLPNKLSAYGYLKANCFRGKKYKEIALLDIGAG